jgi:hypothetical protein
MTFLTAARYGVRSSITFGSEGKGTHWGSTMLHSLGRQ